MDVVKKYLDYTLLDLFAYSELWFSLQEVRFSEKHGLLNAAWAWSFKNDFSFNPNTEGIT